MGFGIAVLAWINWKVLLIVLCFVPVFQGVKHIFQKQMRYNQFMARKAKENLSSIVGNFLQSALLARMHGHEGFESCKVNNGSEMVMEKTT